MLHESSNEIKIVYNKRFYSVDNQNLIVAMVETNNSQQGSLNDVISMEDDSRRCWICWGTDDDTDSENSLNPSVNGKEWINACNCKNTTKWAHQQCLQRWVDEKQKGNSLIKVCCPQCQTRLLIVYPSSNFIVRFLDSTDNCIDRLCPYMLAGALFMGVYWTAASYGAFTVFQIIGLEEGCAIMEETDPLLLLLGLPSIPVALIAGKMIRWEQAMEWVMRTFLARVPVIGKILPIDTDEPERPPGAVEYETIRPEGDTLFYTKKAGHALLLPTFAVIVGQTLFRSVESNFQRAILGGLTYIVVKGFVRMYHRRQNQMRRRKRRILEYTEENRVLIETEESADEQMSETDIGVEINVNVEFGI